MSGIDTNRLRHTLGDFYAKLAGATIPGAYEERQSGAAAIQVDLAIYETKLTTGATEGAEDVTVGDGAGVTVGHRKLITLKTRSHGSDVVNLDHANIANQSGVQATNVDLDAAGEFCLFEWNGSKWQIIHANATVAP